MKRISRRAFIGRTSALTLGLSRMGKLFGRPSRIQAEKSKVWVIKDDLVLDEQNHIRTDRIQGMVDKGIRSMTGIQDIGEAWKSLFPEITLDKVVSIKINCLFELSSHPETAYAIANGLQQMNFGGSPFPANHIIIWDRSDWDITQNGGYTINAGSHGVRCIGSDHSGYGYTSENYKVSSSNQKLSRILTEHTDYLVNLCVLKDHSISQVTFSLKNHYGTCHNPDGLHGNSCDPYIAALNALEPIHGKQMLCICDAIFAVRSGGPGGYPQVTPRRLVFGQDPVAHDTVCLDILNEYRSTKIRMPRHIATAANSTYALGTNDNTQIERMDIDISTQTRVDTEDHSPESYRFLTNYPNPFNGQTILSFRLEHEETVEIDILDIQGRMICTLFRGSKGTGLNQIRWDGRNSKGLPVAGGIYLARIRSGRFQQSIRMQLLK
jgi:uncharacterized protein (DUF362 family)